MQPVSRTRRCRSDRQAGPVVDAERQERQDGGAPPAERGVQCAMPDVLAVVCPGHPTPAQARAREQCRRQHACDLRHVRRVGVQPGGEIRRPSATGQVQGVQHAEEGEGAEDVGRVPWPVLAEAQAVREWRAIRLTTGDWTGGGQCRT